MSPRVAHKTLPTVKELLTGKNEHAIWHPKGAYVHIRAFKINQYRVTLAIDLWNINYDINPIAADAFRSRYIAYLNWLTLKERKGVGKVAHLSVGGTYSSVDVMREEADDWLKQLWELCSDEKNLIPLPY